VAILRTLVSVGLAQSDGRGGVRTTTAPLDPTAALGRAMSWARGLPSSGDDVSRTQVVTWAPALLQLAHEAAAGTDDAATRDLARVAELLRGAGLEQTAHQVERVCAAALDRVAQAEAAAAAAAQAEADAVAAAERLEFEARAAAEAAGDTATTAPASAGVATDDDPASGAAADATRGATSPPWWRQPAWLGLIAATVVVGLLLVVPFVLERRSMEAASPVRTQLAMGTVAVGASGTAPLAFDLVGSAAEARRLAVSVTGADADVFSVRPTSCTGGRCSLTVVFSPDRPGAHLADLVVGASDAAAARVRLTGTGAGDEPAAAASTDLSVTIFPPAQPLQAGQPGQVPVGVTNAGPDPSTGSTLALRAGTARLAAPGCATSDGALRCEVGALGVGERAIVSVTVTPADRAPVALRAQAQPVADTDPTTGNDGAGFTFPVRPAAKGSSAAG
jgi:SWI/SNF-related matrix-associated actin-dependent regulator 1 of chromatin subfamily A